MGWNEDLTWEEWQDLHARQDAVAAAEAVATTAEEAAAATLAATALEHQTRPDPDALRTSFL
jgi:hypothetical protein